MRAPQIILKKNALRATIHYHAAIAVLGECQALQKNSLGMRARCGENNPLRTPAAARRPSNSMAAPGMDKRIIASIWSDLKTFWLFTLKLIGTVLRSDIGLADAIFIIKMVGFGPSCASWLDPPLTPPPAGWN